MCAKGCCLRYSAAQVTRSSFSDSLPGVIAALQGCDFFAFDCEMTGLNESDGSSSYLDDIEDRYHQVTCLSMFFTTGTADCSASCKHQEE